MHMYGWMADYRERSLVHSDLFRDMLINQVILNRGQVYDLPWLSRFQGICVLPETILREIVSRSVVVNGTSYFVLTRDFWIRLDRSIQEAWILQWLADSVNESEISPVCPETLSVPPSYQPLVERYAGRFPDSSGANCFAAALALSTGNIETAEHIIRLWLHEEPFFRSLQAGGYRFAVDIFDDRKMSAIQSDDVIIWINKGGGAVHAAFCVAFGYVFNKMGQNWQQPWSVVPVKQVFGYNDVLLEGGKIAIYRKY